MRLENEKNLNTVVAAEVKKSGVLLAKALEAEAVVQMIAAAHNKTGAYAGKVKVEQRKVDARVVATDPAAAHIEFGHRLSGNPSKAPGDVGQGKAVGKGGVDKWVNGLHIMRDAAIAMGGSAGD